MPHNNEILSKNNIMKVTIQSQKIWLKFMPSIDSSKIFFLCHVPAFFLGGGGLGFFSKLSVSEIFMVRHSIFII